ncbi:hypothetical protein EZV62_027345 [Acer yangbiense]|uniref:DUF4220 domain-containing protein n=1 Tax=Acer yangbiense TaxID=1000413 RepID=A0A5C7GTG2_9ROSI|nr:hypothetical protein EZV62_027345 [Acer yangbiense]
MEIFPETLKKLWNLWEIRSLLLLSLSLQIILILFGSRRKINNPQSWIGILLKAIIWCAYISADWVATVALSVMASKEANCEHVTYKASDSLQAFWAPFLLLHLGGPDTFTTYSLEDNELWLRHFLGLVVQVGVAFYVFLMFWSSNAFTFLAIPVFITGIVKNYNYIVINGKSAEDAFKLVAIELGLMYDLLYTKAAIVYSRFGICLRCITFISSVSALVLFSVIIDVHSYPLTDIIVTYLLLAGAVLLEIYAFVVIFFLRLDKALRWSNSIGQYNLMNSVLKERQCTYLGLEKLFCTRKLFKKHQYLTWENVNISLQETIFKCLKQIADELQENENKIDDFYFRQSRNEKSSKKGEHALKDYTFGDLLVAEEYDARIIMWHIVTDECYKIDLHHVHSETNTLHQNCKISKWLSDYMLCLLLFCPSMLPKGIGEIRYERTCIDTKSYKN